MFENEFESMLRKYGDAVDDKKKFTGLIKDLFPDQAKTINLMLMAYDVGIAEQIQNASKLNNAFAFRFVKQLTDDYGLSRANADWVVSIWCVCYGKNVLGKDCDIKVQSGKEPAIEYESPSPSNGKKYGDLFQYRNCSHGNGLTVYGFTGNSSHTVIFQNVSARKNVIEVGDGIFSGEDFEEVIITDGYLYVGKEAFKDNRHLQQVVMPYTLLEIGDSVFEGCSDLRRVTLTERLEKIGEAAFRGTGLKTVVFPSSVYYIGKYAFADCGSIDNIVIPENIDIVSEGLFENCVNLKKINFSDSLQEIGERAFRGCNNLDIITIPDSVVKIGDTAFDGTNSTFIIQCSFGSYAESFARAKKIKYQLI